mmetsp:Transcript_65437/g.122048  ORF Transcript_65437/g.122048 Transcript_65437/m.122048 type:complete len:456 (-) Transcript_65437:15-1382(-)
MQADSSLVPLVGRLPPGGPILEIDESGAEASHPDEYGQEASSRVAHPPPCSRQACGFQRLKLRARFNLQEISAMKLMAKYDRDRSGALEREELLRLLTDYNDGAHPTAEDVDYILKVTGKDLDKAISVDDLLFALKVWYAYQHLPSSVTAGLRKHGAIGAPLLREREMQDLLQTLNDRVFVPLEEARWVRETALLVGASEYRVSSEQLHQAIAVWYLHMEREKTDNMQLAIQTAQEMQKNMAGIAGRVIQATESGTIRSDTDLESYRSVTSSSTPPESPTSSYLMGGNPPKEKTPPVQMQDAVLLACLGVIVSIFGLWLILMSAIHSVPPDCERDLTGLLRWKGLLTAFLGMLVAALMWVVPSRKNSEASARLFGVLYISCLAVLLLNILQAVLGFLLMLTVSTELCSSYVYVLDWWLFFGIPLFVPPVFCCMCISCGVLAMAHNLSIDQGLCAR